MEVNHRFSIASYRNEEKTSKSNLGINNPKFSQLVSKSQKSLQERLNSKDLQEVFKNKSVAMLFLDKISSLVGKHHPDSLEARKFMGGPCSFPSIELIRHLTLLIKDPSLSQETVQNLEKWIVAEQACLPISLIFDAWGSVNEESVIRSTTKGNFPIMSITNKIEAPTEEVDIFSHALATEMREMKPGDRFKMPAGSVQHVTRLEFTKKHNGTFDIIHFNTGLGVLEIGGIDSTACKYRNVPIESLENPLFWKQFVEAKMQGDMKVQNDLLKNLNPKNPPIDLSKWLKKPLQNSGSCSFHAAEAEFKHSFIKSFPTIEQGWTAYKQCTSLMVSNAVQNETSILEPAIASLLISKEKTRQRYLDWMSILENPEKLEAAKKAYRGAITAMGCYSQEENQELISILPPLMALSALDKRLNEGLNCVTYEQLIHIRNTYGQAVTFDGFNHIGYKQLKWLESTQEVMKDVVEFSGYKGTLILKIRDLSSILLPIKWNNEIQTMLNYAILNEASLTPLLTDYILREDPAIGGPLFQTLIKEKVISENFLYNDDVLYLHIKNCLKSNPRKALELAKKPMKKDLRNEILIRTCEKLLEAGHMEEALEIPSLLEGADRTEVLCEIAMHYVVKGQLDKAMSVAKMTGPDLSTSLETIIDALCENGFIPHALRFTNLMEDDNDKLPALCKVCFELVKRGKAKSAMDALQQVSYSSLGMVINPIVFQLCQENRVYDAFLFVSHIPSAFYKDKSHMDVKDAFDRIAIHLVQSDRLLDARRLALRIPEGPLKESILSLSQYKG